MLGYGLDAVKGCRIALRAANKVFPVEALPENPSRFGAGCAESAFAKRVESQKQTSSKRKSDQSKFCMRSALASAPVNAFNYGLSAKSKKSIRRMKNDDCTYRLLSG